MLYKTQDSNIIVSLEAMANLLGVSASFDAIATREQSRNHSSLTFLVSLNGEQRGKNPVDNIKSIGTSLDGYLAADNEYSEIIRIV